MAGGSTRVPLWSTLFSPPPSPRRMQAPPAGELLVYNTYGICGVCAVLEKRHVPRSAPPSTHRRAGGYDGRTRRW